jgi:hypothetical protein
MAASHRNRVDGFLTKLVGNLPHLLDLELTVSGRANGVEAAFYKCGHSDIPICMSGRMARRGQVAR